MEGYPPGAIWPVNDFDGAQTREVYARYGLAMYMVQVLEHGMVNAAIMLRTLPTMRSHPNVASWQDAFDRAYGAGLARTYGNMLKQLETIDEFPRPLLGRLQSAKEDRDILAHRFFRQHDIAFINPNGRTQMIAWCEQRVELFQSLSDELDTFVVPVCERHGLSKEWMEQKVEEYIEDAVKWLPDTT
jgi:hypothetical protein